MARIHVPVSLPIPLDSDALTAIGARYRVHELSLFGSVLRADFADQSDIDVLVSFLPQTPVTLLWMGGLSADLEALFRRPVDLVHQPALKSFLRSEIIATREVIYVETTPQSH